MRRATALAGWVGLFLGARRFARLVQDAWVVFNDLYDGVGRGY